MDDKGFLVQVVHGDTCKVVMTLGPMSLREADKAEDGLSINLNHFEYSVRIVLESDPTQPHKE